MSDIKNSGLATSLVSYWKLDESSGTRADSHGSNDLTDNNTVTSTTGKLNNAAVFASANNETLSIADASQTGLDITGDLSVSFWFQKTANSYLIGKYTTTGDQRSWLLGYGADPGTTGLFFYTNSSGTSPGNNLCGDGNSLSDSTWYHVVVTYDASAATVVFYVNGSATGTETSTVASSLYDCSAPFLIGGFNSTGYSDATIDEVGIWGSRVLSADDVTALYNSGSGIPYDAGGATFTPKVMFF